MTPLTPESYSVPESSVPVGTAHLSDVCEASTEARALLDLREQ